MNCQDDFYQLFLSVMNAFCFNMIGTTPMPWWLHELVFNKLGPYIITLPSMRKHGTCNTPSICERLFAANMKNKIESNRKNSINNFIESRESTLDPRRKLSLLLWNTSGNNTSQNSDIEMSSRSCGKDMTDVEENIMSYNRKDVNNIKLLAEKAIGDMEDENTAEEWRCVTQAIDRMLLLIFIVVYVTINVVLLLQVPKVNLK